MVEVDPLADVPRTNPIRVGELFQSGRKPTNTENPTRDGKRGFVFVKLRHSALPSYMSADWETRIATVVQGA